MSQRGTRLFLTNSFLFRKPAKLLVAKRNHNKIDLVWRCFREILTAIGIIRANTLDKTIEMKRTTRVLKKIMNSSKCLIRIEKI